MKKISSVPYRYPSARDGAEASEVFVISPQTQSDSYKLAFADKDFLMQDELRPVRLHLEMMKPELIQQEHEIDATVVIFGGARIPDSETAAQRLRQAEQMAAENPHDPELQKNVATARRLASKCCYYEEARKLGALISRSCLGSNGCKLVVCTGGGPGIMEAANRGAFESGAKSIGHNIVLPHEQAPNPYISPELCFQFHYFAVRKMHFLIRARVLIAFPGGYGTMDELFETLTLIQTGKIKPLPVLLFGKEFWQQAVNFDFLVAEGVIALKDKDIFRYVETAEEAWQYIVDFYGPQMDAGTMSGQGKSTV